MNLLLSMRISKYPLLNLFTLLCVFWLSPSLAVEYTVKPGDTLTAIARQYLPEEKKSDQNAIDEYVKQVVRDNPDLFPDENPDWLTPGMTMSIPDYKDPVEVASPPVIPPPKPEPPAKPEPPPVGTLVEFSGQGWLIGIDEIRKALFSGITVREGERILTDPQAKAKIEFVDGSSLILRPSSQVNIDEYDWDAQSQTGRSILSFIKGAFRAVSGLIADNNPDNYQIKTLVGAIGIRGTDFGARLCQQQTCVVEGGDQPVTLSEGIYVGVLQGSIALQSEDRETIVNDGEAIYQKDADSEPEPIDNVPGLIFDAAELESYGISAQIAEPEKPPPFYAAFLLDREGRVIRDRYGACIRSRNYRDDHYVPECE